MIAINKNIIQNTNMEETFNKCCELGNFDSIKWITNLQQTEHFFVDLKEGFIININHKHSNNYEICKWE